jgi:hypothetical protein
MVIIILIFTDFFEIEAHMFDENRFYQGSI